MRSKPSSTDWDPEDRRLLARFVERARARIRPTAIVLFGSFARGDHRPDSDLDLLVVVEARDTLPLHRTLAQILTKLAPRRDVTALPTNLRDMDPSFLRNVFHDGILLDGSLLLTAEDVALRPHALISYSLSHLPPGARVRVSRRVHGFSFRQGKGRRKRYRYPGLVERHGATVLSPSMLLLGSAETRAVERELRALGARVTVREVFLGA
jgi:predicted nucleotidyltransferase